MSRSSSNSAQASQPPLVIFATGGSGTRVVARIVRHAGYYLGHRVNVSEDSLDLAHFLEQRINWFLSKTLWLEHASDKTSLDAASRDGLAEMDREFDEAIGRHLSALVQPADKWGWKAPRSIFILPYIHYRYPQVRVLHVLRDGRDIAYSQNQNQLFKHGPQVLNETELQLSPPLQSIALWSRVNLAAYTYGEAFLRRNYMWIRFEDLCSSPSQTLQQLFDYVGCPSPPPETVQAALAEIQPPPSIGRWTRMAGPDAAALELTGRRALRAFGYLH